jgi:glycerol-3-phosphate dehydrogenase
MRGQQVSSTSQGAIFDVAVIGAGVIGCAVARRLTLSGSRVVVVERAADILAGASKGNSALLHTGFDAPPGSLELDCMRAGYQEYLDIRERLNLPLLETGAAVVAWSEADLAWLGAIEAQARANGVSDVQHLSRSALLMREPQLSASALGGLLVPGEHVIDPWSAPLAYLRQAVENGAQVRFDAEVLGGDLANGLWTLRTTAGELVARTVVSCAGLFGDVIEQQLLGGAEMAIHPRKGQFVVFDKPAAQLLRTTILPVPSERTKGVVLARTVFGNLLVGPTAEEQADRERATVERVTLEQLISRAVEMLPALAGVPVTATYAGLRPATDRKDYRVRHLPDRNWLTIGGIRSTGLTAALGLARHAAQLLGLGVDEVTDPAWPRMPNLAEHRERDWAVPGHGGIVCHCELVSRREIQAALAGPLPARDLGGLKRRTRAGMGRCQGFYCGAELAALTSGHFAEPLAVGHG